jgi:hypothetical protein
LVFKITLLEEIKMDSLHTKAQFIGTFGKRAILTVGTSGKYPRKVRFDLTDIHVNNPGASKTVSVYYHNGVAKVGTTSFKIYVATSSDIHYTFQIPVSYMFVSSTGTYASAMKYVYASNSGSGATYANIIASGYVEYQ